MAGLPHLTSRPHSPGVAEPAVSVDETEAAGDRPPVLQHLGDPDVPFDGQRANDPAVPTPVLRAGREAGRLLRPVTPAVAVDAEEPEECGLGLGGQSRDAHLDTCSPPQCPAHLVRRALARIVEPWRGPGEQPAIVRPDDSTPRGDRGKRLRRDPRRLRPDADDVRGLEHPGEQGLRGLRAVGEGQHVRGYELPGGTEPRGNPR
jgi:hypothetical protein